MHKSKALLASVNQFIARHFEKFLCIQPSPLLPARSCFSSLIFGLFEGADAKLFRETMSFVYITRVYHQVLLTKTWRHTRATRSSGTVPLSVSVTSFSKSER